MRKKEMNKITMTLNVDHLIKEALQEDISSEDVTTNAVMKEAVTGEVQLILQFWMKKQRLIFTAKMEMK